MSSSLRRRSLLVSPSLHDKLATRLHQMVGKGSFSTLSLGPHSRISRLRTTSRIDSILAFKNHVISPYGVGTTNHHLPLSPLQQPTRRSMVVITKTKAGTGPDTESSEPVAVAATSGSNGGTSLTVTAPSSHELIITDACWKQILQLARRKSVAPSDLFLRVYVDAGGCSGFEYKFEVESGAAVEDDDLVWQGPDGARVVVDEGSLGFIQGATLDYVVEMIKSAFTIQDNPLSESACGCGSSFAVKNFSANPALD